MIPPIDCAKHDYLEAACVLRYHVRLTLRDGTIHTGHPVTTSTLPSKIELLVVDTGRTSPIELPMHELKLMEVLDKDPQFNRVKF